MASTADLIQTKLRQRYIASPETNAGALLQRYRDDNNLERWEDYVAHVSTSALYVPALGAGVASTPDDASFAVTDLDVRFLAAPYFWGAGFISNQFVGQMGTNGNHGWGATIHANNNPRLAIWPSGSDPGLGPESTAPLAIPALIPYWHRQTVDVNDGAGNRVFSYYTSADGTSWNLLGSAITEAGVTSIFNSTLPMRTPTGLWWGGAILYAEIRNGINGTIVANPDFRPLAPGTTSFADSTGKTWTLSGEAYVGVGPGNIDDHENAFWDAFVP